MPHRSEDCPSWLKKGLSHVWLPYTQMQTMPMPPAVARTEGCRLILEDGRELIDGVASWWTAAHGYNHPQILAAMEAQLKTMPHVMFGGLAHEPAYRLASRLAAMTKLPRVFFSDSGSVATEVAMKMALQYWQSKGSRTKDRFICFAHGYHGDTLGAMSVTDPQNSMHKAFKTVVPKHYVLDIPSSEYSFAELDETLAEVSRQVAAVIIEPLVQGAGGMKFHSPDTLAEIHRLCHKHDILFIADEIATGFWRTGNLFACDEAGITPDILCLGKALTGGSISLAATLASEEVFDAFLSDSLETALMHGPTYMANPLACAAANASLDVFESENYADKVMQIELALYQALQPLGELAGVLDVRVRGAIGVVQLAKEHVDEQALRQAFAQRGVWIRPFYDVVYVTPPLVISPEELQTLTDAMTEVITDWSHGVRQKLDHLFG